MGIPKDEGIKGERQDENKEETMEDRTGIERARRLETEADTESNQEARVIENERKRKGDRKRTKTENERGNRRETGDIGNSGELETNGRNRVCAEKDDEKGRER
jgi:hypothetical protein